MEKRKNQLLTLNEVCEFLQDNDNYLILTHSNPDGDTLGSAYGLALILDKLGKASRVVCPDKVPEKYNYFIKHFNPMSEKEEVTVIAVDVADTKLLGCLEKEYAGKVKLCIDHHLSNKLYAEKTYLDSNAAANCECVYDIAVALGVRVNSKIAMALYTGISTDTGCFRFSNSTAKTLRIAADLMERKIDTAEINRLMFETKSRSRIELECSALNSMEFYLEDKVALVTVTREMIEKSKCDDEDLEGLTSLSRSVEGVLVGVTLRQKPDNSFKASIRTYPPIDASEICKKMGGGGHIRASGCQFSADKTIEEIKTELIGHIKAALEENHAGTTFN